MIIKIDHIALGTDSFDITAQGLKKIGYTNSFYEKNVTNMVCTKEIMQTPTDTFDIALFEKKNEIGIELLNYGHLHKDSSHNITPLITDIIPEGLDFENFPDQISNCKFAGFDSSELKNKPENTFKSLLINTPDMSQSIEFWKLFRFTPVYTSETLSIMKFKVFFPKADFFLYLRKTTTSVKRNSHIDEQGYHILAFISDNVVKEQNLLKEAGCTTTCISDLLVNKQLLNIFFVRSPSGVVAEVISVKS